MNEERNPYAQPYSQPGSAPGLSQEVFQAQQQPDYPTPYPSYGGFPPQQGGGAAKVFSILSFALGCLSLFTAFLCLLVLLVVSGQGDDPEIVFGLSVGDAITLAAPGLVFGILALVKKTRLFLPALLGVIFNGILLLVPVFGMTLLLFTA